MSAVTMPSAPPTCVTLGEHQHSQKVRYMEGKERKGSEHAPLHGGELARAEESKSTGEEPEERDEDRRLAERGESGRARVSSMSLS
jgi:hypothetical protein